MAKLTLFIFRIYKLVQKNNQAYLDGFWQFPKTRSITSPTTVLNFDFDLFRHDFSRDFQFSIPFFPLFQKMPITRKSNLSDVVEMLPNWPEFHFYLTKSLDHDNHSMLGSRALVDLQSYKTTLLQPRTSSLRRTVCLNAGAREIFSTTHNALQVWR